MNLAYQPSNYCDAATTSRARVRPRTLNKTTANCERLLLQQQESRYTTELFKRNNTLKAAHWKKSTTTTTTDATTTNIREQHYQHRLSFDDWVKTKKHTPRPHHPPTTTTTATAKPPRPSEQTHSKEFQRWLSQHNRQKRTARKLRDKQERQKKNADADRALKRQELHDIHEEREKKDRLRQVKARRQAKQENKAKALAQQAKDQAQQARHAQARQKAYQDWLQRKRRERHMVALAHHTAVEQRRKGGLRRGTNRTGVGGLTNLEDAMNLDVLADMYRSNGGPPSPIPVNAYGGFGTSGLLTKSLAPGGTGLYVRYIEEKEREEAKEEKEEREEREDTGKDPYEAVGDFVGHTIDGML